MSVAAALTLLPAVLSLLGDRVNSLKLPYLGRRIIDNRAAGRTSWIARVAYRAMKRPAVALVVGVGVLLLLAYPALDMKTGVSGVNSFPDGFESKQGFAVLEKQFSAGGVNPVQIVVDGDATTPAVQTAMTRLTDELAGDPAFGPVQTQTARSGDLALLTVPVNGDAVGSLALDKVRELRGTLIPQAFDGSGSVRLRHRPDRRQPRLHRHREQLLPVGRGARPQPELPAAPGGVPVGRHPAQGDPDEPAQRRRGLRSRHPRLAQGMGRGPAGLPAGAGGGAVGAAAAVRRAVRALHGLSGLPAEPHQGGVGQDRRQHARPSPRASAPPPASSPGRR